MNPVVSTQDGNDRIVSVYMSIVKSRLFKEQCILIALDLSEELLWILLFNKIKRFDNDFKLIVVKVCFEKCTLQSEIGCVVFR